MILSLVCDQEELSIDQLTRALGLSTESVIGCVERLEPELKHIHVAKECLEMTLRVASQSLTRERIRST